MNNKSNKKLLLKILTGAAIVSASNLATAQLTQNLTIGNAKALSLGNAVTADPPGIDSIHFNPAGLINLRDRQRQFNLTMATFSLEGSFGSHGDRANGLYDNFTELTLEDDDVANKDSKNSGTAIILPGTGLQEIPLAVLPTGGFSYQIPNTEIVVATAAYVPEGAGYTRSDDDPGRYQGKEVGITRLTYLSPSVAWRTNEKFTVGLSFGFSYQGLGINTDLRSPTAYGALLKALSEQDICAGLDDMALCGSPLEPFDRLANLTVELEDLIVPSFNLGFLWEPYEWLNVGMVYRSESEAELEGDFTFTYDEQWDEFWTNMADDETTPLIEATLAALDLLGVVPNNGLPQVVEGGAETGTVKTKQINPMHLALGVHLDVTARLAVNVDLKWTEYSKWDQIELEFSEHLEFLKFVGPLSEFAGENTLSFSQGYNDVLSAAIGFAYVWDDRTELRFGFEDRPSAIPDDRADLLLPFGDAYLISAGVGYQLSKDSIVDVALGYVHAEADIAAGVSKNANGAGSIDLTGPNPNADIIYNPYAELPFTTEASVVMFEVNYRSYF